MLLLLLLQVDYGYDRALVQEMVWEAVEQW